MTYKVFTVLAKSESCDEYGPYLFTNKPTRQELLKFFEEICPDEVELAHPTEEYPNDDERDYGPGNYGYLHVEIHETEVINNVG